MKTFNFAFGILMLTLVSAGCSTGYYSSGGSRNFSDDMYATHDRARIAHQQKQQAELRAAEAEARRAEWDALLAEARANAAENSYYAQSSTASNPYRSVLADTYESAYARRLYGFKSATYNMPSSYWNLRYSSVYNYVSAYDPAQYNIIVMGDNVWVEPKYITSMFGSWGRPSYSMSVYASGLYNRWYFDWGYASPYYSWTWGYPRYSWGYSPFYGWNYGWGWRDYHWGYPGWGYPGWRPGYRPMPPAIGGVYRPSSVNRPGQRPQTYPGGYNRAQAPAAGRGQSYNVGGNRAGGNSPAGSVSGNNNGAASRRNNSSAARSGSSSSNSRGSYNSGSNRNGNGGSSSYNQGSSRSSNSSSSSYNSGSSSRSSGGSYSGGGSSNRSGGGNSRGR